MNTNMDLPDPGNILLSPKEPHILQDLLNLRYNHGKFGKSIDHYEEIT